MADPETPQRRFLLDWPKWVVWLLILVALAYFAWVIAVGLDVVRTPSVDVGTWARIGAGLFVVIIVLELLLLIPRSRGGGKRASRDRASDGGTGGEADADDSAEISAYAPPPRNVLDVEYRVTGDQHKGLEVLELSHPPKSFNEGGVYAKTYIKVSAETVLRIEDLVAEADEVAETNVGSIS